MTDLLLTVDRFWISPYAYSAFVALEEKKLAFDVEEIGLDRKDHKKPEYRMQSITGRVPALRHGDFWLAESAAIVEYLEDMFPTVHVLPTDPREKARARQIMGWVRSDLNALREERPTTSIFYAPAEKPLTDEGRAAADKLIEVASTLLSHGRPTIFGSFTIADADLALMLQRLKKSGETMPARLAEYADAIWALPSVKWFVDRKRPEYVAY